MLGCSLVATLHAHGRLRGGGVCRRCFRIVRLHSVGRVYRHAGNGREVWPHPYNNHIYSLPSCVIVDYHYPGCALHAEVHSLGGENQRWQDGNLCIACEADA